MPTNNSQQHAALMATPKTMIAVGAVLPTLVGIVVALRFYIRHTNTKPLGSDDFLILFALVPLIGRMLQLRIRVLMDYRLSPSPWNYDDRR